MTSNQTTLELKCKRGCDWKLKAIKNSDLFAFEIVTYNGKHECCEVASNNVSSGHIHLTSSAIFTVIQKCVAQDPSIRVSVVRQMVKDKFGIDVPYKWASCVKQKAIVSIYGSWEDSYALPPRFFKAMQQTNPGTIVEWSFKEDMRCLTNYRTFHRVFWAFKPCIDGFKYCKPLIAIHSTHLFGKYRHSLLTAISQDGNKGFFPLAFALVEKESTAAWSWFMSLIRRHVIKRVGICVISKRHASIMATMEEPQWQPPLAYHRFCIRHLLSNFNRDHGNIELKKVFGTTVDQRQQHKVTSGLRKIGTMKPEALTWIDDVGDICKWSLCHDGGYRYGVTNTNEAEFFNYLMKGVRFLPVTKLVEFTFYRVNDHFVRSRENAFIWKDNGNIYTSHVAKIIAFNSEKATFHEVTTVNLQQGVYQVKSGQGNRGNSKANKIYIVDLGAKTCTCNKLTIYHLPCSHVLAVCIQRHLPYSRFIDHCYTSESYANTYTKCFMPMIDKRGWPSDTGFELSYDVFQPRNWLW